MGGIQNAINNINALDALPRQAVLNGNCDVWSTGTSFTNPANGTYTADVVLNAVDADGGVLPTNIIHSRQALTPGDIEGSFYFYRINVDGAGSSYGANASGRIAWRIEHGTRLLAGTGNQVTLSFYARSSIANKKLGIGLGQRYGTGGSPTALENIAGTYFGPSTDTTLTSSWKKFTHTFTLNTTVGKTFGTNNDDILDVRFAVMWGSSFASQYGDVSAETYVGSGNIDIAQVQLCQGAIALDFQPSSIPEEARKCQRYNYRKTSDSANTIYGVGQCTSTTSAKINIPLVNIFKAAPTVTSSGNFAVLKADGTTEAVTVLAANVATKHSVSLTITTAGNLVAGNATVLIDSNDTSAYLNLGAVI